MFLPLLILVLFDIHNPPLDVTQWIDVCQSDGNMLATGGKDENVKIFDKREYKIVQTFDGIHPGNIFCLINFFNF